MFPAIDSAETTQISKKSLPSEELNREIIKLLQEDGRLAFKDIANALNVSEGTIRNRVQWMKEAGMLKIVALADPQGDPVSGRRNDRDQGVQPDQPPTGGPTGSLRI